MKHPLAGPAFQSKSAAEAKADATTRSAMVRIDAERAAREKKTAQLKAARLAKEADEIPIEKKVEKKARTPRSTGAKSARRPS